MDESIALALVLAPPRFPSIVEVRCNKCRQPVDPTNGCHSETDVHGVRYYWCLHPCWSGPIAAFFDWRGL